MDNKEVQLANKEVEDEFLELYKKAYSARQDKDLYAALKFIDEAKHIVDNYPDLMLLEAKCLADRYNLDKAIEIVSEIINNHKDNEKAYQTRARFYMSIGSLDKAYADLKQTLNLNKNNIEAKYELAKDCLNLGRYEESRELFRKLIHKYRNEQVMECFESVNYFIIDDLEEKFHQCNKDEKISLAKSYFFIGEVERAYSIIKDVEELKESSDSCLIIGNILSALGESSQSLYYVDRALELESNKPRPYFYKGHILEKLGMYEEALQCYRTAIELDKEYEPVYNNMISTLTALEKYEEALKLSDRALKLNYDIDITYNSKGIILYKLGRSKEAIECYDLALEIRGNYLEVYLNKSRVLRELKNYRDAMDVCNKAVELRFQDERICIEKALILKSVEEYENAIEWIDWAIDINDKASMAYFVKGICLCQLQNFSSALEYMNKVIHMTNGDLVAYSGKIFIHYYMEEYEECIKTCLGAINDKEVKVDEVNLIIKIYKEKLEGCKSMLKIDDTWSEAALLLENLKI